MRRYSLKKNYIARTIIAHAVKRKKKTAPSGLFIREGIRILREQAEESNNHFWNDLKRSNDRHIESNNRFEERMHNNLATRLGRLLVMPNGGGMGGGGGMVGGGGMGGGGGGGMGGGGGINGGFGEDGLPPNNGADWLVNGQNDIHMYLRLSTEDKLKKLLEMLSYKRMMLVCMIFE